jgi:hypothetical protein
MQIKIDNKEYVTPNGGLLVVTFTVSHNEKTFQLREGLVMSEYLENSFIPFMEVSDTVIINILNMYKQFSSSKLFN